MAQFVKSSYCRNRCFDRGLCYFLENEYHCLCHQPSTYDDCRDNNLTTTATTITIIQQKAPSTVLSIKTICAVVLVMLLGLALIALYGWHQIDSTRRNGELDEARSEAPRVNFRASAPPLEERTA